MLWESDVWGFGTFGRYIWECFLLFISWKIQVESKPQWSGFHQRFLSFYAGLRELIRQEGDRNTFAE